MTTYFISFGLKPTDLWWTIEEYTHEDCRSEGLAGGFRRGYSQADILLLRPIPTWRIEVEKTNKYEST